MKKTVSFKLILSLSISREVGELIINQNSLIINAIYHLKSKSIEFDANENRWEVFAEFIIR